MAEASESGAQRRLWLLQRLLPKMDAEKALELAGRMEAFVTANERVTLRREHQRHQDAENPPTQGSPTQAATAIGDSPEPNSGFAVIGGKDGLYGATPRRSGTPSLREQGSSGSYEPRARAAVRTDAAAGKRYSHGPRETNPASCAATLSRRVGTAGRRRRERCATRYAT